MVEEHDLVELFQEVNEGTQTTWYVFGILVFYALFPAIYLFIQNSEPWKKIGLVAGFVLLAILTAYVPILDNSMIVWARLPIFTIGAIIGLEDSKEKEGKWIVNLLALAIVVPLGYFISLSELSESFTIPQICRFLLYIPMTLAIVLLLSRFRKKVIF